MLNYCSYRVRGGEDTTFFVLINRLFAPSRIFLQCRGSSIRILNAILYCIRTDTAELPE